MHVCHKWLHRGFGVAWRAGFAKGVANGSHPELARRIGERDSADDDGFAKGIAKVFANDFTTSDVIGIGIGNSDQC